MSSNAVPSGRDTAVAPFPVVGIGASAGGLEACTQLLRALPHDTGLAFVLVQHLAPSHPSALAEILARATRMPVVEVHDELVVAPNHVYVIPPGQGMIITGGVLKLIPRPDGLHHPVDQFLCSLARDQGERAIGVILSGTANDGTMGLEAIRAEGGITFAQDGSAQHDGMPHSAIRSGSVDFIMAPDAISRELVRIAGHPHSQPAVATPSGDDPALASVMRLLRDATGVDFSQYKLSTLLRRIARRMVLRQVAGFPDYVRYLEETPGEAQALYQDFLIGVTRFFRDPSAWEAIEGLVLPKLLRDRAGEDPVRVWAVGCSTGQEAYSLAIAFTEYREAHGIGSPLLLFATDLSSAAIETARAGIYPAEIADDVSPERLRRFFVPVEGGFRVGKAIRDACVFSRHNVLSDPPFSHIDLISCRNLLIYLESGLQQRVLALLHYALSPGGYLWLGGAETVGSGEPLFVAEDAGARIYSRRAGTGDGADAGWRDSTLAARAPFTPVGARHPNGTLDLTLEADRLLALRFAPPAILVSGSLDIVQYRGDTSAYLTPADGGANPNLLKLLRGELLVGVRDALVQAGKEGIPVRQEGLRIASPAGEHVVTVEVCPLGDVIGRDRGYLIVFEEPGQHAAVAGAPAGEPAAGGTAAPPDATGLLQELKTTRHYLQSVIGRHEAANVALQSANEEIQSANEELQSVNEELETSKEEIQTSNEELATLNDELTNRNRELSRLNDDLANLLGNVHVAVIVVDGALRVRHFTATAASMFNLTPASIGQPFAPGQLAIHPLPDLEPLLATVLQGGSVDEREVQDPAGRWFALRLRPYVTRDGSADGVVLTFADIDATKRAHEHTSSIVATVREPLLVLDADLRVRTGSAAFFEVFGVTPDETIGRYLFELGQREWDVPALRALLLEVLPADRDVRDFEVQADFPHLGRRTMVLNARRLHQGADVLPGILLAIEDLTDRRLVEEALRASDARIRFALDAAEVGEWDLDLATGWARRSPRHDQIFGHAEPVPEWGVQTFLEQVHPEDRDLIARQLRQALRDHGDFHCQCRVIWPNGEEHYIEARGSVYRNALGQPTNMIGIVSDITARSRAQEALQRYAEHLSDADRRKDEFLALLAHELRNPLAPIRNALQVMQLSGDMAPLMSTSIRMIDRQVGQLVRLVDDLLDVSRFKLGRIALRPERVELSPLIEEAIQDAESMMTAHGLTLTCRLATEPLLLEADRARMAQVVGNLLFNACKFTEPGGTVTVKTARDGTSAIIAVQDTGIGLAAGELNRIFELFAQVDTSLTRPGSGLGIGLTLVRQLVEQHGGTVQAASAGLGRGSEFTIRLPLAGPAPEPARIRATGTPAKPRRILVVDDNRDSADSLATLLRLHGHATSVSYHGPGTLAAAEAFEPEVILLDIGLPGMSGYEVARRIREQPWGGTITLIAMTGWGEQGARDESRLSGFNAHLVKPVELTTLMTLLDAPDSGQR